MNSFLTVSQRDKVLLAILAVLAVGFLYFKLLILPGMNEISTVNAEIENNKQKLEDLQYKKTQNTIIKNTITKLQGKYDAAKNAVTIDPKDADISSGLFSAAAKNNVKLTAVTYSPGVEYTDANKNTNTASSNANAKIPSGRLMRMDASINIAGNISDIIKFVKDLENTERIDAIGNVSINKDNNSNKAAITTSYFYFTGDSQQQTSKTNNTGN